MEPKTALQKKIVALSATLEPINEKQKNYAFGKCFERWVVKSRNTLYCLECGHTWKEVPSNLLLTSIQQGCVCSNCNSKLKLKEHYNKIFRDSAYYSAITTKKDLQVIRMFFVAQDMKKGHPAHLWIDEVMQHWIDKSGNVTTLSKKVQGLSHYYDQWIFESKLEVRMHSYKSTLRYDIAPYKIYPEKKILPIIKRNGYKGHFHGFRPWNLFSIILSSPAAETLLKTKQIAMLQHFEKSISMQENWPSIKICIRNGYTIKEPVLWEDYISLLRFFSKDVHSPKYVCPANLKREHDRLVRKKREIDRKKKIEELRKQLDTDQVEYAKQKSKFFTLIFTKENIKVKTIESVEEIMIEGDKLHHCVFTNAYHKKPDSLIMSARLKDEPVETIEFSLKSMEVIQSRGSHNAHSKYHNQILDIVNSNIPLIAERLGKRKFAEVS